MVPSIISTFAVDSSYTTYMMKKTLFMLACAALAGCSGGKKATPDTMENNNFKPFNVQEEFVENGFSWFTRNLILCVGDSTESNAMTIGWGAIGNYLGHERPAVSVYVAPARYTYDFMERHQRFTIMQFDDPKVWQFMGKRSGREFQDDTPTLPDPKAAALGLTLAYTPNGTPYYKEATMVIECETMTAWHQSAADFRNSTPKEWYDGFEAGIHTVYIGEVLGAWKK